MAREKKNPPSWKEEAWEEFLIKKWDARPRGANFVRYTKEDLSPILAKYTKSGQGEIRIFHSGHIKFEAVKKRAVMEIPISRGEWLLMKIPPKIVFDTPAQAVEFTPKRPLTPGMIKALELATHPGQTPGETTLLSIARYIGIIEDFYGLTDEGVMFTGGRQAAAGCQIIIDGQCLNLSKAQIEIDGGFEWPNQAILVEVKSSLNQKNFEINQALLPLMKWKSLMTGKTVSSMVLLCKLNGRTIVYHAYDLVQDTSVSPIGMKIASSKKYTVGW